MSKFNLMLIGTLAIGIFALPGVVSTFSNSHDYIAPENVDCQKCHPDVYSELLSSQADHTHANAAWTKKQVFDCEECHTVSGIGDNPAKGHAAQKVDCAFCHNKTAFGGSGSGMTSDYANYFHNMMNEYGMNCDACHTPTGDIDWVYDEIIDPDAAHYGFYMNSVNDSTLLGGTESCIGCHTHVEFNMTKPLGTYNMTYDPETGGFGKE